MYDIIHYISCGIIIDAYLIQQKNIMKNQFALMAATVMLLFTACNDESSTSTTTDTDSTTNNTITTNNDNVTSGTNDFEARSYMI